VGEREGKIFTHFGVIRLQQAFIRESKKIIRNAINNRKLVLFVGAGVSANSGLPSWGELVGKFGEGLGIDCKNLAQEDYLRIPQYYYNSRGRKEYYDLINKVFNKNVMPNLLHSVLLELKPCHFITTNFDSLIEDAAREKGMFFDVVSKDEDLPYTPNNNMIIKLHGELKYKNIVLKEDDYLSYSTNFKLIENYVKSLLSTHLVLFVGYSVNDIDVKLIFQWVKDSLKKDFQPAYFISTDSSSSIDLIEFNYFKNRGINILYSSGLTELTGYDYIELEELKNERAVRLYNFLRYLSISDEYSDFSIDYFVAKVNNLNKLNRIRLQDVLDVIKIRASYDIDADRYITVYDDKFQTLISLLKSSKIKDEKILNEKVRIIEEVFLKANVLGFKERVKNIESHKYNVLYEFDKSLFRSIDLIDEIIRIDYRKIKNWLDTDSQDVIFDGNEQHFLKKAYAYFKVKEYYEAYKILKRVSDSSFRNKNYHIYFISEVNRKTIGRLMADNFWFFKYVNEDQKKTLDDEVENIDLEKIYYSIPDQDRTSVSFVREIINFNYIYSTINHIANLLADVEEERTTLYIGGTENGKIHKLQRDVKLFWEYINSNYLILDIYSEVKSVYQRFIEGILMSLSADDENIDRTTMLGFPGNIIKLRSLDYFSYFIMVNYSESKFIRKLFDKYDIQEISVENLVSILYSFQNTIDSIISIGRKMDIIENLTCSIFILSRIDVESPKNFSFIIEKVIELIRNKYVDDDMLRTFNSFIVNQHNRYRKNIDCDILDNLIYDLLKHDHSNIESGKFHLIESVTQIIKLNAPEFTTTNIEFYKSLFIKNNNRKEIITLYIPLSRVLSEAEKDILSSSIILYLKESFDFNIYYSAVSENLIKSCENYEDELIKVLEQSLSNTNKGVKRFPNPLDNMLERIAILLINNLIIQPEKFNKFSKINPMFDLFSDFDAFNYNEFNVEWLENFSNSLHDKISLNETAKMAIKSKTINLIINNQISKRSREVFFKYYN
jgi:hypothetical protein